MPLRTLLRSQVCSLVLLLLGSACMYGPYDGQEVETTTEAIEFWGFHVHPQGAIQLEGEIPSHGTWERFSSTTAESGSLFASHEGLPMYYWQKLLPVPAKMLVDTKPGPTAVDRTRRLPKEPLRSARWREKSTLASLALA